MRAAINKQELLEKCRLLLLEMLGTERGGKAYRSFELSYDALLTKESSEETKGELPQIAGDCAAHNSVISGIA